MANITSIETIAKIGNLQTLAADNPEKIEIHLLSAKTDVIDIVSNDVYEEMLAKDEDDEDRLQVANAEAYLALCYIIPAINIESAGAGVTKSTGFGDGRKENLSESDIESIIDRYRATANKILSKYAPEIDNDGDDSPDIARAGGMSMIVI